MRAARSAAAACALAALIAGCSSSPAAHHEAARPSTAPARPSPSPHGRVPPPGAPVHTLIVMLENHNYSQVIGRGSAPYLNELARSGALFTNSRAITHPSQPNYLALFSGSTQGVTGDDCPQHFTAPNLASELLAAGYTFTGYAEGLPAAGSGTCNVGSNYARRHVPWTNFSNVPPSASQPFTGLPGGELRRTAHGLVRDPQPVPRHAQLLDEHGERLGAGAYRPVRELGDDPPQPADRGL